MGKTKLKQSCTPNECGEPITPQVPDPSPERLAQLAWAIAHPARVQLLRILLAKTACVCGELVDAMPLSQSTVSQHLKIMKEAGLIQGEIDGPKVCYCVNQDGLARLKELVAGL